MEKGCIAWRSAERNGEGEVWGLWLVFPGTIYVLWSAIEWYVNMEYGNMTEKEKMLAGLEYSAVDAQLLEELNAVKEIIHEYNMLAPSQTGRRREILKGLLGHVADDEIIINQPFYCDYGKQISVGRRFFANFHLTILDEARVTIGDDCFIGPNVSIYTACHSTDPVERNSRREWAEPVTIGNNVWIGGSVTILPGVTIGNNVTIGAGSVVTKDIPDNVVAVGNPCRVVKKCDGMNV
jgi:maltose O-acetyltransferase